MTKSDQHDPLPPHVAEVVHDVVRKHVTLPHDLEHLGPLAEMGHRHYQMAIGLELEERPTLHADCITFMEERQIYPSNHPDYASASRLAAVRKIDAVLPGEIKNVLNGDSHDVIPQNGDRHFDLADPADQPLSS